MLPNFVHIGTPKSGSGTISRTLRRHPQVYTPRPKELNFFNNSTDYAKGAGWYEAAYFADHQGQPIACDNSIGYSAGDYRETISRIAETLGRETKVLITVRHPVERAYSQYCMARFKGQFEKMEFADAVRDALAVEGRYTAKDLLRLEQRDYYSNPRDMSVFRHAYYITPGRYADLLGHCIEVFGGDNVLLLFTEDMAADLGGVVRRLTDFLGVDPIEVSPDFRANEATALRYPWLRRFYNLLYAFPPLRRWYNGMELNGRRAFRKKLMSWNYRRNDAVPRADPAGQALLQQRYLPEMIALQDLSGRDLSHWINRYPVAEPRG